jgi:hypothetical protein
MTGADTMRLAVLVFILGAAGILGGAGAFADSLRERWVFAPAEARVADAVQQMAQREKSLHMSNGHFVGFSNADVEKNSALLGLPWSNFPVADYYFDATELETGNIRLRALPRPNSVVALAIRARLYVEELSPEGKVVRSGWYPFAD